jgi:hypothetical protein
VTISSTAFFGGGMNFMMKGDAVVLKSRYQSGMWGVHFSSFLNDHDIMTTLQYLDIVVVAYRFHLS